MPARVNVDHLLSDIQAAATEAAFTVTVYGYVGGRPLLGLIRSAEKGNRDAPFVYLSAGIHGDEPAGPVALLQLLREEALPHDCGFLICPLMNPAGIGAATRENADGVDLNRDYARPAAGETRAHCDWIEAHLPPKLALNLHLHEDWETDGFYLYEIGPDARPGLGETVLSAVAPIIPIQPSGEIDGHHAEAGIIRPGTERAASEGLPEALFLHRRFGGISLTFETPSGRALLERVAAQATAVQTAVRAMRPAAPENE